MIKKFFIVILLGIVASGAVHSTAEVLTDGYVPGTEHRLAISYIENQTPNSYFQVFYKDEGSRVLLTPNSKCEFKSGDFVLNQINPIRLICSQGSYLPIYVQDEGLASGQVPSGYHGPYYVSMWLSYPHVADEFKVHVRYAVLARKVGEIGIRIGSKGDCQIVALSNVKLLP